VAQIAAIEQLNFGKDAYSEEKLTADFEHPLTDLVIAKIVADAKIIGYTYARPVEIAYAEYQSMNNRLRSHNTAYIDDTSIHPDFWRKGLNAQMAKELEDQLRVRSYTHFEIDAAIRNGYANNIRKNYANKIEIDQPHDASEGQQVFFRVRL
jgi:ribosomal protein S18 acetylase RimI-like enzyme